MTVEWENRGGELVAALTGELDHHAAGPLREQMDQAVEQQGPHLLRLDFGGVTFMDSSGIGLVMGRYRLMRLLGGDLIVSGASPRVRELMRLAGLDRLDIFGKEGV